jgi:hypothetical protein
VWGTGTPEDRDEVNRRDVLSDGVNTTVMSDTLTGKKKINVLVKECFRTVLLKPVEGMRDRWAG